jgi:putative aldouronate transport system permease protein
MGAGLLAYLIFRILPLWGLSLAFVDFNIIGGLSNSPSLILSGLISSWNVVIARNFIQGIPGELEEAAKIDGCSYFGTFFHIILPLSTASLATLTLFIAVGNWNQYTKPLLYLNDYKLHTLQVYLKSLLVDSDTMGMNAVDSDRVLPSESIRMATVVLAMFPIMCVYPFVQRYFVKGVMVGSVKG